MSEMDPHNRINLTGPWAGFGFQGGHMQDAVLGGLMERERPHYLPPIERRRWEFPWMTVRAYRQMEQGWGTRREVPALGAYVHSAPPGAAMPEGSGSNRPVVRAARFSACSLAAASLKPMMSRGTPAPRIKVKAALSTASLLTLR